MQSSDHVWIVALLIALIVPLVGWGMMEVLGRALAPYELMPWESGTQYLLERWRSE